MNNTPVKRCSICGEQARGFNFNGSLVSCNACKQFFYRYSDKFNELKCFRNDNCSINSAVTRNDCKKCRMDKCLTIGMKIDLVRKNINQDKITENDIEIVVKNDANLEQINLGYILEKIIENETNRDSVEPNIPAIPIEQTINSVFLTNSESSRITEVYKALSTLEDERNYRVIGRASQFLEAFQMPHENVIGPIISFCCSMEPFNMLSSSEQLQLLKVFFCEVMFVKVAFGYDRVNDGFYVLKHENEKQSLFIPYSCLSEYKHRNLVADLRKVVLSLGDLMENDVIVRDLILALLLYSPRNENTLPEFMRYHYFMYCYLLKRYLESKHQDTKIADKKFNRIMSILNGIDRVRQFICHFLSETNHDDQIPEIIFEIHDAI